MKQINEETKTKQVLKHLTMHGSITSWEAIIKYRVTRLSGLIYRYRKSGMNIISEQIPNVDYRCVRYRLIDDTKKGDKP